MMSQTVLDTSIVGGLRNNKVSLTVNLLGRNISLRGVIVQYSKPFIQVEVGKVTRIFNENNVKEIIPVGELLK
jgi:hypothetical protein